MAARRLGWQSCDLPSSGSHHRDVHVPVANDPILVGWWRGAAVRKKDQDLCGPSENELVSVLPIGLSLGWGIAYFTGEKSSM